MKYALSTLAIAVSLLVPLSASAQNANQPLTRAQVRAQLIQLERAGYNPARKDPNYPTDIQAAEARIHNQTAVAKSDTSGYGTMSAAPTQSGHMPTPRIGAHSIYSHH